ncbi:COG2 family protein [Akkermansiaceae bacterium]|nr:COG2 family protein [Akkermansiaceae bacterium]
MKVSLTLMLALGLASSWAQERPEIPEDLLDDEHFRSESGLNEFTVPSIAKVFNELEKISPLSYNGEHLKNHEILPLDRSRLALRLGTLIADGFIAVQTGHSDDVPAIASHLSRYAKALGAGDRIKRHAAALLDHAKAKDLPKLKEALAATQRDVERELIGLRDPDLSTLISLGGWLQALEASSSAVNAKFTPERAKILFREDIADYYAESIGSLNPKISEQEHILKMRELLQGLRNAMVLTPRKNPTPEEVKEITGVSKQLAEIARK